MVPVHDNLKNKEAVCDYEDIWIFKHEPLFCGTYRNYMVM